MPAFCRVEGDKAGPNALGILIPPGRRTLVILRPRALDWDLLLLRPEVNGTTGPGFWEIGRSEAAGMAQRVYDALEEWAGGGPGSVDVVPSSGGIGYRVRVASGPLTWVLCRRVPGRPYQPMVFGAEEEARAAAASLEAIICPGAEGNRELYWNTHHFAR